MSCGNDFGMSERCGEAEMWQAQSMLGYTKLRYDSMTQERRRVVCNSAQAAILNMHPEELEARFANCDLRIVGTELDFVYLFVEDIMNATKDLGVELNFRLDSSLGKKKSAVLVCSARRITYNLTGQALRQK